jgi:hypothetical protein
VSAWDSGSTFPTSGFTANATVFKWQQEYMDLSGSLPTHRNAVTHLGFRLLDGSQGRTIWLDDLKYTGSHLSDPSGSTITSTPARYFQYRTILTSSDPAVSAGFSAVSLNYLGPISPPTSCRLTDRAADSITINWQDNMADETGFELERSIDGGAYAPLSSPLADATSHLDSTIQPGFTYTYRIRGYRTIDETSYTDWCTTATIDNQVGTVIFDGVNLNGVNLD